MRPDNLKFELVAATPESASESPLRVVYRALRGRYRPALTLGACLAVLGGVIGFSVVQPTYVSRGLIRIDGAVPPILYETQEHKTPPMFDAYVASQVSYLRSGELLRAAVARPEMRAAGWAEGTAGVATLAEGLSVERPRGEDVIRISVAHNDPALAFAGANAVLDAYRESEPNPAGISLAAKEQVLVEREAHLERQLQTLREQVLEASDQYGHDATQRIHSNKVDTLMAIDDTLDQIRQARRRLETGHGGATGNVLASDLGAADRMARLRQGEIALQAEIQSSRYKPGHPIRNELDRQLKAVRIQMDLIQRGPGDETSTGDPDAARARLDELEATYTDMRERLREDAAALGRRQITLEGLGEQVTEIKNRLATTRRRLDEIRFIAGRDISDRVTIIKGGLPWAPSSDRRAGLATAGVLFGFLGGPALFVLLGLVDPRIRFVDQIEGTGLRAPVLGVLPHAKTDRALTPAVDGLHTTLELNNPDAGSVVHAVTGAGRGEGRTTLARELAGSFVRAGRRTLLIDADFVQPRLTTDLGLATEPGLREAIADGSLEGRAHQTGTPNLRALPVGAAPIERRQLTRDRLRRLLDEARQRFDAVIIDAGPIVSDFEACQVAAVADHVLLLINRTQHALSVQAAAGRLEQLGVECMGVVFNRAAASDYKARLDSMPGALMFPATAPDENPSLLIPLAHSDQQRRAA